MTDALLLDTHVILWFDSGDQHLLEKTRALIDDRILRFGKRHGRRYGLRAAA